MSRYIENYIPLVKEDGIITQKPVTLSGTAANLAVGGTLVVTGTSVFTGAISGPTLRTITDSALAGATVALTAGQSGQTFNNRSTSGSPSWTLPTASNGLWFSFTCGDATTGFTVTGGTVKALTNTSGTGTAISGTTLTHTQATADVGDHIVLVCDGTVWRAVSQGGIFAAA